MSTIDAAIIKHITEGGATGSEDKFVQYSRQQISYNEESGNYEINHLEVNAVHFGSILRLFNKETQETEDYILVLIGSFTTIPSNYNVYGFNSSKIQGTNGIRYNSNIDIKYWQNGSSSAKMDIDIDSSRYEIDFAKGHGIMFAQELSPVTITKILQAHSKAFELIFNKIK